MCKGNESANGGSICNLQFVRWRCFFFLVSGMEHGVPTWYTVGGYLPYLPFGKSGGFGIQVDDATDRHKCWSLEKWAKIH